MGINFIGRYKRLGSGGEEGVRGQNSKVEKV